MVNGDVEWWMVNGEFCQIFKINNGDVENWQCNWYWFLLKWGQGGAQARTKRLTPANYIDIPMVTMMMMKTHHSHSNPLCWLKCSLIDEDLLSLETQVAKGIQLIKFVQVRSCTGVCKRQRIQHTSQRPKNIPVKTSVSQKRPCKCRRGPSSCCWCKGEGRDRPSQDKWLKGWSWCGDQIVADEMVQWQWC